MSLESLAKELDNARKANQARWMNTIREQHESVIRAKDEEISSLRGEIETLRRWLDSSALPALNPVPDRSKSMGLIGLNFGENKPCPDIWSPGERDILDSIGRDIPEESDSGLGLLPVPGAQESPSPLDRLHEGHPEANLPKPPRPERSGYSEQEIPRPGESETIQDLAWPGSPEPRGTEVPEPASGTKKTPEPGTPSRRVASGRPSGKARKNTTGPA